VIIDPNPFIAPGATLAQGRPHATVAEGRLSGGNLLGNGKRLFEVGFERIGLRLIDARPLNTGAAILHYWRTRG